MLLEVYDRVIVYDPRYYVKTIGSISEWVENLSVKDIYCILSEGYANDESFIRLCNIHY